MPAANALKCSVGADNDKASRDVSKTVIEIAKRFAAILIGRRYDTLDEVLSPDCRYEFRDRVVEGSTEIIEVYRKNTELGFDVFDRIGFESEVHPDSVNSARVTFTDHLFHNGEVHDHKCQQNLFFDDGGLIHRIVHVDLDGEGHALDAFFAKCGLVRPKLA